MMPMEYVYLHHVSAVVNALVSCIIWVNLCHIFESISLHLEYAQ